METASSGVSSWQVKRIAAQESAESPGHLRAKMRRVRGTQISRHQEAAICLYPVLCIQYMYIYIYIHTHKRAWVQDQSLSMALTLNDPAPWMLFPPLTLVLCDSGRDKQPPKLDGWLLKVNKHVAPLTLWPLMFESSAKATEMSPSMPPFASRQRSMMLGVQGNRDQPSTWVHGHFQVPLSWSQVDPSWPWVDPGRA